MNFRLMEEVIKEQALLVCELLELEKNITNQTIIGGVILDAVEIYKVRLKERLASKIGMSGAKSMEDLHSLIRNQVISEIMKDL